MYEKGPFIGSVSRGIVFVLLLWIYEIFIIFSAGAIGIEAIILFWLPALPLIGLGDLSNNMILLLATCMWFLIGCGVNLIMYYKRKITAPKE